MSSNKNHLQALSNIIVTIATVIFALVSLVTVFVSLTQWQAQREASRPYFTFKESPKVNINDEYNFEFRFTNVGIHPAINLHSQTFVFEQSLTQKPIHVDEYAIVNDIPKDTSTSLIISIDKNHIIPQDNNIKPYYIVLYLEYDDPIINKIHNQMIYIKWNGVINGRLQPLIHAKVDEKEKILNYLSKYKMNPTTEGILPL